jgi:hypothetical protein
MTEAEQSVRIKLIPCYVCEDGPMVQVLCAECWRARNVETQSIVRVLFPPLPKQEKRKKREEHYRERIPY